MHDYTLIQTNIDLFNIIHGPLPYHYMDVNDMIRGGVYCPDNFVCFNLICGEAAKFYPNHAYMRDFFFFDAQPACHDGRKPLKIKDAAIVLYTIKYTNSL